MKPFHMNREPWTDDRIERLKVLHREGYSASQIASRLRGVTRNAVIGKCHRLGLLRDRIHDPVRQPKDSTDRRRKNVSRRSKINPSKLLHLKPVGLPATSAVALNIGILALGPNMCRWPVGDGSPQTFCGCAWAEETGPYCATHTALAYVKPTHKVRPPKTQRAKSISIDWLEAA
jgi:GcrA cell cycle regulator